MTDTRPIPFINTRPRFVIHSPRDIRRLQETLRYKQRGQLLELGFGRGGFLALASRYFDVTGIDLSFRRVAGIQSLLSGRLQARRGDIEHEEFGRERFDVVAAFNILEHTHQPALVIDRIHAGLRGQGILVGSVPNNHPLLGQVHTWLTNLGDPTHFSTYPPGDWLRLFQRAGFSRITFLGELLFSKYLAFFLRGPLWRYYTYNLVFVCEK